MRDLVAGLAITLDGVTESPARGGWFQFDDEVADLITAGQDEADTILIGRNTYLEFAELWPSVPAGTPSADFMNGTPKVVVSSTLTDLAWGPAELLSGDVVEGVRSLKALPGRDILIPGSPQLVGSMLAAGLLDRLSIMIMPTVFGSGSSVFDPVRQAVPLTLIGSQTLRSGVVSLTYRPVSLNDAAAKELP